MRSSSRFLSIFAAAVVLAAAAAPAFAQGAANQDVRPNAWYWGIYGGQTSFATAVARTTAPTGGVEWVLTRQRFALNIFAEQSYFNAVSTVVNYGNAGNVGIRRVDIQDMRRVGASGMFFLPPYKYFHPWLGAGYAFNMIRQATPEGSSFDSPAARDSITARINNAQAQGKLFGEFGMMFSFKQLAPFIQYSVMPSKGSGSWFVNGDGFTNVWKAGVRYSFGPSIDERW